MPGNDINSCGLETDSPWDCKKHCVATESCRAFTWVDKQSTLGSDAGFISNVETKTGLQSSTGNYCCLKSKFGYPERLFGKGLVSGSSFCGGKYNFVYLSNQSIGFCKTYIKCYVSLV